MKYKIQLLVLLIIVSLTGCFFSDPQTENDFEHYIRFEGAKGEYIYFPTIIDDQNNSILELSEYHFKTGSGTINKVSINGTDYLNISLGADEVEIKVERKGILNNFDNFTYSGIYIGKVSFGGGPLIDYPITEIYYSGNNTCDMVSYLSTGKNKSNKIIVLGPAYLSSGFNSVGMDYGGTLI